MRIVVLLLLTALSLVRLAVPQSTRNEETDRAAIVALENQWLQGEHDCAALDRILASDFVHVVPVDHFLSKEEHIAWAVKHPQAQDRHSKFGKLDVRFYGNTAIVNGSVIASDGHGKELDRSMFTDVFVFRDGRWQAVNAQENAVREKP